MPLAGEPALAETTKRKKRRNTSHLKLVPATKPEREALRARCVEVVNRLDKSRPPGKDELEIIARATLEEAGLAEGYVGWTMVALASAFWQSQVASVPYNRRLFLLPHCLKHAEGCPADYDEFGLDCKRCGACSIADFRSKAEELGYKVLVAEGSPIVLKIIVGGYIDAITGVACLNVLEKAIDKILLAGIPCMAVPLLSSDCRNTSVDEDWVMQMIETRHETPQVKTKTYVHLMRSAASMFEPNELERLAPRLRGGPRLAEVNGQGVSALDPVAGTEAISYDFLAKGGKHSRPFITLAVYDALKGGLGTEANGADHLAQLPDAIKRTAMSIETFHKASLVHDDIEDDDQFRYGDPTVHRKYGIPTAINVGDYLIGLGYRLISRDAGSLGPDVAADILDRLADAHMKLSEGQGAELLWRDSLNKQLKPLDALKIYALKTAPAFEAALYSGLRLAGPVDPAKSFVGAFARHLGVAFQILNDLNDWRGDNHNKLLAGGDVLGGRPTVLWALALEGLGDADRAELMEIAAQKQVTSETIARIRALYEAAGVFEKASRLVDKYQERAEAVADEVEPEELRRLLYYLIDSVLERPAPDAHEEPTVQVVNLPTH
jgi:geranylgeranyl pyrophosphate synthase